MKTLSGKTIIVDNGQKVYNWHKNYKQVQLNFLGDGIEMRREKLIKDFIKFNAPKPVHIIKDNAIFTDLDFTTVDNIEFAKTVLITDQRFSRLPCPEIIRRLNGYLNLYKSVLVCLNRTYINIDNSFQDTDLNDDYQTAIGQWLTKNVNGNVTNLSTRYFEDGTYFTWVIPDQIFWITP